MKLFNLRNSKSILGIVILCFVAYADAASIRLQPASSGTFYVAGSFSPSINLNLLVDTGSSFTILDPDSLAQLVAAGSTTHKRDIVGTMADGSERNVAVYHIKEMWVGECILQGIEAVSLGPNATPVLGMNALRELGSFSLDFESHQLSVNCRI